MPQIKGYDTQQIGAEYNGSRSNANLLQSGMGQALDRLGGVISDTGDAIHRRQAQEEVSNLSADFAQARSDFQTKIDDDIRNGSVDATKIQQNYQDYVNKLNENVQTREGRSFFDKQSSMLGGSLIKSAARGQAAVAGAKAEANIIRAHDLNTSALQGDPSHFQDVYTASLDSIDAQVQTGVLPAEAAEKLKHTVGVDLAKSAVRGWANLSPEIAEKKLKSGEFDQYFDGDTKAQMQSYIHQATSAKEAEAARVNRLTKKAEDAHVQNEVNKLFGPLEKNEVSATDIIKRNDLPWKVKEHLIDRIKKGDREDAQGNFRLQNEMFERLNLPESDPKRIQTPEQLLTFVGSDGSKPNMADVNRMSKMLDNSPQGKQLQAARTQTLAVVKGGGGILNRDMTSVFGGGYSADSQTQLQRWAQDNHELEQKVAKEGKDILKTLYDPKSPDYVASPQKLNGYRTPLNKDMQKSAQALGAVKLPGAPTAAEDKKSESSTMKRPGETIQAWKARTGM